MSRQSPERKPLSKDATAAYEATIGEYQAAVETMHRGDFARAKEMFHKLRTAAAHEPELADRALTYARVCERKLGPPADEPTSADDRFRRAVFLLNLGEIDEALQLLTKALSEDPTSVDLLYVRACAWAKQGSAEKAVGDLRQAMAADPKIRFQAVNDPDFERIREEPSFIDIIEPTPSGV